MPIHSVRPHSMPGHATASNKVGETPRALRLRNVGRGARRQRDGRRLHLVAAAIAVFVVVIGGVVLSNLVTQRGARPQGGGHSRAGCRRGRWLIPCHRAIRRRVDAADDALRERVRAALDADEDVASYRFLDVPPPELDDDQATPVDDRLFIVAARYRDDVDIDAKIAADPGPVMDVEVGTPTVSGEEWAHVCSFSASDWIELDG
jgi:hypothetical protein